ncbi:tyrosine-protein phosphatase [Limibacterium fermenti]|uniref:tyrosine-protein phosphatase n=1 Tax=Limibacterium fermenti TaxID=3229863 RepID=UPI000E9AD4FC|nr:capsular biosynthesis protein [Porphyromonadaceae bacterium]
MRLIGRLYSLNKEAFFEGFTDYHSHILPGVDDGVQTLEQSLEILDCYEQLGIRIVWLTPHIMEDIPNTTTHLQERFACLQSAYRGKITLHLAAEYMLDNLFQERFKRHDLLPLGERGNRLLVETSYLYPAMKFYDTLRRIKEKGYYPVLAHPERYNYMGERGYKTLKEMGVKFQLNLLSLDGMYGKTVRNKARWLLDNGMYDLIGTDVHTWEACKQVKELSLSSRTLKKLSVFKTNGQ